MFSLYLRPRGIALLAGLLAVASAISGCDTTTACTAKGCGPNATLLLSVPAAAGSAAMLNVKVCRDADCRTAQIKVPAAGAISSASFDGAAGATPGSMSTVIGLLKPNSASALALEVTWQVFGAEPKNGERYTVAVSDGNAAPMASLDKTATYEESTPNGKDCAPVCKSVTLQ